MQFSEGRVADRRGSDRRDNSDDGWRTRRRTRRLSERWRLWRKGPGRL